MEIDKAIISFSEFLNRSWDIVIPLLKDRHYTSDESSIGDWLQANWEILVEKKILQQDQYLEIYGDGADYFGASSRILDVEAEATFSINVLIKNENVMDLLNNELLLKKEYFFDKLVGFKNGFYINEAPFNYVLVQDDYGIERVISLENSNFKLAKI